MEFNNHHRVKGLIAAILMLVLWGLGSAGLSATEPPAKQRSLDEWRALTATIAPAPRVFVKGDQIRFFFPTTNGLEAFEGDWSRARVPTDGYKVHSALLRWDQRLPRLPAGVRGWREATVIAGAEWRQLATNLISELTPKTLNHAAYYQAFLADGVLFRDGQGAAHFATLGEQPREVSLERRFSVEETLEVVSRLVEAHLAETHPKDFLFLVMAPNSRRFTQPLLLDRARRRCVLLSPAALYDATDSGLGFGVGSVAQSLSAILLEGHGLALVKNPISSATRLADLGVQSVRRFLRFPLPRPARDVPPLSQSCGMDLAAWESWLDHYTGTRRQDGSARLLIDGDRFYSHLRQAVTEATNHVYFNVYIFDRDDVAVRMADLLKERSRDIDVKVILDRLGSLGAGFAPPATALPESFVAPPSIRSYLTKDSKVRLRPFLNPWFSSDHSKVYLVDGTRAWVGGMNLGREYRYEWHDLMVELTGPVVGSLEADFSRDWAYAGPFGDLAYVGALLNGPRKPAANPASTNWTKIRLLPTRTAWKPFSAAVLGSLQKAQSYVYVENPYLFDKRVIIALVNARHRGVDVRVVLPRVNDLKAGGRGNLVVANYLLEHGVRVYFYPGMTHVKALLVDGWACLGSGNLNHLSLRVCQEQNLATSDPAFAASLTHELFEQDFAHSYELTEPISVEWGDFLADFLLEGF